jgi:RNA polymerase sigma factor (sigma-70 family)
MDKGTQCESWNGLAELVPLVRAWTARRCADASEIDDLVQETLLRAVRSRRRGQNPQRLEPWLLRIAANALADRGRREGRVRCELQEDLHFVACPESMADCVGERHADLWQLGPHLVERETALGLLRRALSHLREEERSLLETHYSGDCGSGSAKHRLYRARRRLSRALAGPIARAALRESQLGRS